MSKDDKAALRAAPEVFRHQERDGFTLVLTLGVLIVGGIFFLLYLFRSGEVVGEEILLDRLSRLEDGPHFAPDAWGWYTIEVEQCSWGHRAKKPTWLYLVGVEPERIVIPPWRPPTRRVGCGSGRPVQGMWARERRLTTPDFARWLVDLAATI